MIERTCVDSRCSYGQHDQVPDHRWAESEHTCGPWPDWAKCDLRALATEALYRFRGGWAGPATIQALGRLIEAMPEAQPEQILAEFTVRGRAIRAAEGVED